MGDAEGPRQVGRREIDDQRLPRPLTRGAERIPLVGDFRQHVLDETGPVEREVHIGTGRLDSGDALAIALEQRGHAVGHAPGDLNGILAQLLGQGKARQGVIPHLVVGRHRQQLAQQALLQLGGPRRFLDNFLYKWIHFRHQSVFRVGSAIGGRFRSTSAPNSPPDVVATVRLLSAPRRMTSTGAWVPVQISKARAP